MKRHIFKFFLFLCLMPVISSAQIERTSDLYKIIISGDDALFNIGFNRCDVSQFENLLSEKFEFFHDKDGISDKPEFISNLKNGLCKSPETYQSRRELVAGSTEIYPLYKNKVLYGAVQAGVHKFYETSAGKPERYASTAKFMNVWLLEDGEWKLNKSFSFDHQASQSSSKQKRRKSAKN